jgi:hypothetical protein
MANEMNAMEITEEQAIKLHDSGWWIGLEPRDIVKFQLFEDRLCMPFDVFHEALEKALGRPVWTHELGLNHEGLQKEFLGEAERPTMEEIINLIPEEKRIIIVDEN